MNVLMSLSLYGLYLINSVTLSLSLSDWLAAWPNELSLSLSDWLAEGRISALALFIFCFSLFFLSF